MLPFLSSLWLAPKHPPTFLFLGLLWATFSVQAEAHLMSPGHGTLNLIGSRVYLVLSLPLSAFVEADLDQDGQLGKEEFQIGYQQFLQRFRQGVRLSEDTEAATWLEVLPTFPKDETAPDHPTEEVIFLAVGEFSYPPKTLTLTVQLWGDPPTPLQLTATEERDGLEIRNDRQHLTPSSPVATFFAPTESSPESFLLPSWIWLLLLMTGLLLGRWIWLRRRTSHPSKSD